MNIGWIGLGEIGTEMVKRLLAAGFRVTVYERGQGLEVAKAAGAGTTGDYAALAAASDLLTLCVFSDAQLRDILYGHGVLAAMRPGSIVAIHTTGSPALARELAAAAPDGVTVIDVTFSGGPKESAAGTLTLMAGGDEGALARARPAFEAYATNINHVGAIGSGQVVKLLNNLLFATNLMNAANILRMAEQQGFDGATVARIIGTSSGASFGMRCFDAPTTISGMLEGARPYMEKDVATAMSAAAESGLDMAPFRSTAEFFKV